MKKRSIRNLFYMVKPIWQVSPMYVIISVLYTFENIPSRLLNVMIVKYIVDAAAAGRAFGTIVMTGLGFLGMEFFLLALKRIVIDWYKTPKESEIRAAIKQKLFDKIKNFDMENFDDKEFYDRYTLAFGTADDTAFKVFNTLIKLLASVIAASTLLTYMVSLSPLVIVAVLVSSAVSLASSFVLNKYKVRCKKERIGCERKIDYVSGIYSARSNAADIRMGSITQLLDRFFDKAYKEKIALEKRYGRKYTFLNFLFESPLDISDMFMWLYIAHQIIIGVLGTGDFMSLSNAAWSLQQQIRNVFNVFPKLYEYSLDIENILVLDSYRSKLESTSNVPVRAKKALEIRVRNLSFSYPAKTKKGIEIVKNINFDIKPGEKVALVGHNGAGKSTIVKLILRFYDPTHGSIYLNGRAYNAYNLQDLRGLFSTVFQDYQYYSFSIAENILLRSPRDRNDIEVVESALREVGLYDKVHNMPLGVHTQLTKLFDNDGMLLSGGELQKLAIARAIAQDTPIIIMDEPSSALDPLSEREIADILTKVFKDKIVFIISHRLSLTKNCDKIMVIDHGDIVEQGRHEELTAYGGKYAQLWEAQARDYREQDNRKKCG